MKKQNLLMLSMFFMMISACASNPNATDTFKTRTGKKVVITAIKHASIRITYHGKEFEIDPVGGMEPKTDYSKFPKADYILITHEHFDHLDKAAIASLEKKGTVMIANKNSADILGKGKVMNNWDSLTLAKDITLKAVPAYNITPGHTQFHPQGRDNGYILTLDGLRIYIAGDTEDINEMKDIHDIDIAFLPCNQPYTMTPEQVAKVARIIKPKVLFPYHYSDTKIEQVSQLLRGTHIDVRIRNYQ